MTHQLNIHYHDRYTGKLESERVWADSFLNWAYNSRMGRRALEIFLKRRIFSRLYGWYNRQRISRRKIRPFVEMMGVDTGEMKGPLDMYGTFNEFFIREIDLAARPIRREAQICIAPVDGKVLAYSRIGTSATFRVKRSEFNLETFLRDRALAGEYNGGSLAISRLSLRDYHHFHFPDSGVPGEAVGIPGALHAGGPYALRTLVPFYAENHRVLTPFESDHFGRMLIVEIGALTVGSIRQVYQAGARITKGDRKGFFELGGSTVVLLFKPGVIRFDEDILANTESDVETYVRMGDSIGGQDGLGDAPADLMGKRR
jgi:phosphatidylserine decarboxylase